MNDIETTTGPIRDSPGAVEVRVFRHGTLISTERCESVEDAAAVVESRSEEEGIQCEIDDLSYHHGPVQIDAPEVPDDVAFGNPQDR